MASFTGSDDLRGAEFVDADLHGARFVRADMSGVVMRAVEVRGADIDAPWLFRGESFLRVNGVDVIPLVEAELNRRFPGRAGRCATDPDGLRAAWAALERTWAATLERVAAMPAGTALRDVLEVRAGRVAMVRDFLANLTSDDLTAAARTRGLPNTPRRSCRACT